MLKKEENITLKIVVFFLLAFLNSCGVNKFSNRRIYTTGKQWEYQVTIEDSIGKVLHSEILKLNVLPGNYNGNKSIEWLHEPIKSAEAVLLFEKYNPLHLDVKLFEKPFTATTSVIENHFKRHPNVWIHPPREAFYMALELCPFPEVYLNLAVNDKWSTKLGNLNGFGDWDSLSIESQYTYLGSDTIDGSLKEKYSAISNSAMGSCSAKFEFEKKLGFSYLEYILFDKNVIRFELITK